MDFVTPSIPERVTELSLCHTRTAPKIRRSLPFRQLRVRSWRADPCLRISSLQLTTRLGTSDLLPDLPSTSLSRTSSTHSLLVLKYVFVIDNALLETPPKKSFL